MSIFIRCSCTITVIILYVTLCKPSPNEEWNNFKLKFKKQFKNITEDMYRMRVYFHNKKLISKHNKEYKKGRKSFFLKMNQFGDFMNEEFKDTVTKLNILNMNKNESLAVYRGVETPLPESVDWRARGALTPVKSQGNCGSCWAFSAAGALESQHFMKTGNLVSLSEQNLLDCSTDYGNDGCMGGFLSNTYQFIVDQGGISTEESYPYEGEVGPCRFNGSILGATATGYVEVPQADEVLLQNAVAFIGPVAAGMNAENPDFQFYGGGIYDNKKCDPKKVNHGVIVTGYGVEGNSEFWILKNSMSQHWGEDGYMRILRNANNQCGIASVAVYPVVR